MELSDFQILNEIFLYISEHNMDLNGLQDTVDYIAHYVDVKFRNHGHWRYIDNTCSRQEISFTNTGLATIKADDWTIYFKILAKLDSCYNASRRFDSMEPVMEDNGFQIYHVEGTLYRYIL